MTGIPSAEYQENFEVNQIKEADLTPVTKKSRISEAKKSFVLKKNSSIKTIFNLTNTMVGSSIVVLPNLFQSSGVITSLIVLIVIGLISCKTCILEISHFKIDEVDLTDAILRILGKKWFYFFNFVSILLLFVSGIIYFLLIAKMGYSFLSYFFITFNVDYASQDVMDFTKFSYQYFGIICIFISFMLFSLKDLKIILKLGQYGLFSIILFFFFVIVKGILNMSSRDFEIKNVNLLTSDFATVCGVFASAFFLHNLVIPIIKNNKEEKNNKRDIILGYVMAGTFYSLIGIFGAFSIAGLQNQPNSQTVLDYYGENIYTTIIELLLFLQLISVLPILWYVARTQLFNLIYKNEKVPNKYFHICNLFFSIVCLVIQLKNVDPTLVISLNGAICCYFLIYTIPIAIHLQCLYGEKNSSLKAYFRPKLDDEDSSYMENYQPNKIDFGESDIKCVSVHGSMIKRTGKKVRYTFYAILSGLGLAFAIIKILSLFIKI